MVSIEAREGVTTGISAADRARTIAVAVDPASGPEDLVQPGHVFPLRARSGGVLERAGRTEAAVELTAGAGLRGAGVLCQVMRDDGHMASGEDLEVFAARHGIAIVDVSEVVERRPRGPARRGGEAGRDRPADARRDGPLRHRRLGRHRPRRGGAPVGTTANAISSVSLDPPLMLACLARSSETLAAIRASGRFAVNILAAEQRHHSDRFAKKGDAVARARGRVRRPRARRAGAARLAGDDRLRGRGDLPGGRPRDRHRPRPPPGAPRARRRPLLFYRGSYSEMQIEEDELAA